MGSGAVDASTSSGVVVLANGNYVVGSANWKNGDGLNTGAVTWCNGDGSTVGDVSSANSLVGSSTDDHVGAVVAGGSIVALTNGHYVVASPDWSNGALAKAGAVTWGNGSTAGPRTVGPISETNSLIGAQGGDQIGLVKEATTQTYFPVTALTNGHYVVGSPHWDNGAVTDAGAVTWGNGLGGTVGTVSTSNSLVGSQASDQVGGATGTHNDGVFFAPTPSIVPLTNGNYVVGSPSWNSAALAKAGAVTWGNGLGGTVGAVSTSNSLVGASANSEVGSLLFALTNGHYVVSSPAWDGGRGAATWGNGSTAGSRTVEVVSATNSLVGSTPGDLVSRSGITPLTNGHYVVGSALWSGSAVGVGAATWANGTGGTVGTISATNSLVGSTAADGVSSGGITALASGHYVVQSPGWDHEVVDAGAVTWGNGSGGTVGGLSESNSLFGNTSGNQADAQIFALSTGDYLLRRFGPDDSGAVTFCSGRSAYPVGPVSAENSVIGPVATPVFDAGRNRFLVGQPPFSIVSIFSVALTVDSPMSADVTDIGATLGGKASGNNGPAITERGVVYAQTDVDGDPHLGDPNVIKVVEGNTGLGEFSKAISGLDYSRSYSFRAYATNAFGPAYSAVATFTTLGPEIFLVGPTGSEVAALESVDFGTITRGSSGAAQTFSIRNIGERNLTISGISSSSEFHVDLTETRDTVVPTGGTVFSVTFAPVRDGVREATLRISSNDRDEASYDILLTGIGAAPLDPVSVPLCESITDAP